MATARDTWHMLTGEYPPRLGGIADYGFLVAGRMAEPGSAVHVWTGPLPGEPPPQPGVTVHAADGRWTAAGLARLDAALAAFPAPARLLVQYAPNAWGARGLNFGFPRWLRRRRSRGDAIRLMVHEPFYPFEFPDKPARWALAAGQRWMMREALRAAERVYVSMEDFEARLRPYMPSPGPPLTWVPVPSTIPKVDDPEGVAEVRRRVAPGGGPVIGNFVALHGGSHRPLLKALPELLAGRADRVALLLGRHSGELREMLLGREPGLADRVVATGPVDPAGASRHLQACDLLIQTYTDGASSRRTTLTAGLEHGLPVLTNLGFNTGPIWTESGCVAMVPFDDPAALAREAEALLADPARRARLAEAAAATYARRFALEHTVAAFLADDPAGA